MEPGAGCSAVLQGKGAVMGKRKQAGMQGVTSSPGSAVSCSSRSEVTVETRQAGRLFQALSAVLEKQGGK